MSLSVRDALIRRWMRTQHQYVRENVKKVYYLSLEFLMGRLLGNALFNVSLYEECGDIVKNIDMNIEDIIEQERDMGLGNGGLGRLAACFLDSMATLDLPAFGYGIRYEYGIFYQDIQNGHQVERPDNWLSYGNPWEIMRPDLTYKIQFGGRVNTFYDSTGKQINEWIDTEDVLALAYDIPIPGYNTHTVNNLRLWQSKSSSEFNFEKFNQGDYFKAVEDKNRSENISKVLYPNDNTESGKVLRLKQQFFFTSATLQDIIRRFKILNNDFRHFPDLNAIHLNDTHPAIAVAELMRLLIDVEKLDWEVAWDITQKTLAYTNHTVMSEALEKWAVPLFERLLPRHLQIITKINALFLERISWDSRHDPKDTDQLKRMSIFEEGHTKMIKMSNLAIVGSHSVNGVAALHTEIIKKDIFKDFYAFFPNKFSNKTNGITQRRWLLWANPYLSKLITQRIGDGWITDLEQLRKLEDFAADDEFMEQFDYAKWIEKRRLMDKLEASYNPLC
jgi:starch phosphorylase